MKLLTSAALLMSLAAVVPAAELEPAPEASPATPLQWTPATVSIEVLAAMDRTADPCQDFYRYACGGWLDETELPVDRPSWTRSFSSIRERNQEVVRELLDEAASRGGGKGEQGLIGRYYGACMNEAAIEKAGSHPVERILRKVRKAKDPESLLAVTAELHRSGIGALFEVGVLPDFKNPELNVALLVQGGLGLPDRDYYLSPDDGKRAVLEAYQRHVARMLALLGDTDEHAAANAADVVAFETRLAEASRDRTAMRDLEKLYHRLDLKGLVELTPNLPWKAYLDAIDRPGLVQINVATPEFFTALEDLVAETDPEVLQTYLRWQVVNGAASLLPARFAEADFDFYGRTLSGQQEMEPRWKRCVDATEEALGEPVGRLFVERMFAGDSKEIAMEMIGDIEAAFAGSLPQVGWMDDVTRARAKEKVEAVTNKIGYPDSWEDYSGLRMSRTHYFANALAASRFHFDRELGDVGRPVDRSRWDMPPQTVNAFYNPLGNEMVFPAGILQPPFFHRNFPTALNYGGIGGAIGHELTHGFDDQGRKFDAAGQLREWWEPTVADRFEKRAQCVSDYWGTFEVEPGLHVNGDLTLGENIADIGGLKQAFRAYKRWEARHGAPPPAVEGLTNEQLLFVAWGQAWCTVMSPELARLRVTTDPHSPPRFRVIGPMAHVPAFAEAFSCAPGTPANPEQRCEVW